MTDRPDNWRLIELSVLDRARDRCEQCGKPNSVVSHTDDEGRWTTGRPNNPRSKWFNSTGETTDYYDRLVGRVNVRPFVDSRVTGLVVFPLDLDYRNLDGMDDSLDPDLRAPPTGNVVAFCSDCFTRWTSTPVMRARRQRIELERAGQLRLIG